MIAHLVHFDHFACQPLVDDKLKLVNPLKRNRRKQRTAEGILESIFLGCYSYLAGWWYTYLSEQYESPVGMIFPIYGK